MVSALEVSRNAPKKPVDECDRFPERLQSVIDRMVSSSSVVRLYDICCFSHQYDRLFVTFPAAFRYYINMGEFTDFYRRYQQALLNYMVRLTADPTLAMELVQESFTRCLSRYGRRKSSRVLLFKIARNAFIDEIRRQKHFTGLNEEEHLSDKNLEKRLQIREEYKRVLAGMNRLDSREREVLAMIVSTDLTYREIAEITGLNETNLRVKVHRARVKLKQFLAQEEDI